MNDWTFTPYDQEVDLALEWLCGYDTGQAVQIIADYINKLENIIYGYTE